MESDRNILRGDRQDDDYDIGLFDGSEIQSISHRRRTRIGLESENYELSPKSLKLSQKTTRAFFNKPRLSFFHRFSFEKDSQQRVENNGIAISLQKTASKFDPCIFDRSKK